MSGNEPISAELQAVVDREAIRDCILRYCRGIDRCDPELVAATCWPGATDDHSTWSGSAIEFVGWVIPLVRAKFKVTQHLIGNVLIELDDQQARVESYFQAFHGFRDNVEEGNNVLLGGRYPDRMEKRNGEWRVRARVVVFDWFHNLGPSQDWSASPLGQPTNIAGLKPDDLLYCLA